MASVTLNLSSLNERELRAVLVAHYQQHHRNPQPTSLATTHAAEHNGGRVGCIVRVAGSAYEVTTLPLTPASAEAVMQALTDCQVTSDR
jgi:hypothetical protein